MASNNDKVIFLFLIEKRNDAIGVIFPSSMKIIQTIFYNTFVNCFESIKIARNRV